VTTLFYPGNLQWFGIKKEVTYGTAQAVPDTWIPVDTPKWNAKINPLVDQAMRGYMGADFQQQQGMRYDEITYKTFIYADTVYPHFLSMLGNPDTVTGTTAPYTHKTSLYNGTGTDAAQPVSYTGFFFHPSGKVVQVPGLQMVSLKIDVKADELPTLEVTWNGMPGTFITAPANTPGALAPMPAWTAAITVGGVAMSKYSDVSFEFKRGTKPIPVLNGTQSPLAIYAGELTVAGSLDAIYQGTTDTDLTNFLANTQPSLKCVLNPPGDAVHTFTVQSSVIAYDSTDPNGTNQGWMTIQSAFKALMNATDALDSKQSPAQAQLINTTATAF
jgi:hypothetical protein